MNENIIDTVVSYNDYLKKLPEGCQTIADLVREDRIHEAMNIILQFSEGMGWVVDANLLLDKNGYPNPLRVERIHEFLKEINSGLEIQDYILVADMFEYEIKPFFEECTPYDLSDFE